METISKYLKIDLITIAGYKISVSTLLIILLLFLATKLLLALIKRALYHRHGQDLSEMGNIYSLFQIIRYAIWAISIILLLGTVGIKVTALLASSAALLVGIGIGLQHTFNDILSGIILLSERSIKIGDILEIDGDIVKIQSIGIRTSTGLDRDEISIIIPNSLITTSKVINWSHQSMKTRFKINVGVAYGSDVDKVIKVLEESALEHPDIYDKSLIEARITNFGNSSIDFQLLFFSENIFRIEKVKSDIRKIINQKFIVNNITIPFPQMDLNIKGNVKEEDITTNRNGK